MIAVNAATDRPRARVSVAQDRETNHRRLLWHCPVCGRSTVGPIGNLHWVLSRARLHMSQSHGYKRLAGFRPPKAAPALAAVTWQAPSSAREATVITFTGPGRPRGHVVPPLAG